MQDFHCRGPVDPVGRAAVAGLLDDGVLQSARYDRQAASTNSWAMVDLQESKLVSDKLPRIYLTDSQSQGRGRLGRTWVSDDSTLTFSLVVSTSAFKDAAHLLSLAVGVGVARAIEHVCAPLKARLKWPNDVYVAGGKVAGILVEATQTVADIRVIGIGINVGSSPKLPDSMGAPPVTDLARASGGPQYRYAFLEPTVHSVHEAIEELGDDTSSILQAFRSRCILTGHHVQLSIGEQQVGGLCDGVTNEGELILATADGKQNYRSGEAMFVRKHVTGN